MRRTGRFSCLFFTLGIVMIWSIHTDAQTPPTTRPIVQITWDWSGIIGTGQSLAVGQGGRPAASTKPVGNNLMLRTGKLPWPIDPADPTLAMAPLIEPIGRPSTAYPSSWPTNIAGETPHAAMADEITALVKAASDRDFVSVHTEVGENGQGIRFLKKNPDQQGVLGHAFAASLIETKAIARLARAAGKSFGVGAIIVTHGENDAGNAKYEDQLHQLWQDYSADLPAVTGQTQPIQMILSQQNSTNNRSASTLAQWKIGVDFPDNIVCCGPKYQYPSGDGTHLTTLGYRELGEKYGQVYFDRVILGQHWQPLQPTGITRNGKTITVHFHVPVEPLVWDTTFDPPHQTVDPWKQGKGFELSTSKGQMIAIESVEIAGDDVVIACATDPGPGTVVSYAMIGEKTRMSKPFPGLARWGLLRDSDPFQGAATGKPQPNYAVAFEMPAP
jgi:lysophospholipase L1-like esterase